MADIVDDFLTRLQHYAPDLPSDIRHRLEVGIRQDHGGTKPYVAKQTSRSTRISLVSTALRMGLPISECFAQAGVSRRTGYRILASK